MSHIFQSKIEISKGCVAPDEWDAQIYGNRLPDEVAISYFATGEVASRVGDLYWNWTPYDPEQKAKWLVFNYWEKTSSRSDRPIRESLPVLRGQIVSEMQRLMTLIIYKKRGPSLSFASLAEYVGLLRKMGKHCETHSIGLNDLWMSNKLLGEYCSNLQVKGDIQSLARSMTTLMPMDPITDIGYTLGCTGLLDDLLNRIKAFPGRRQTPPIPTGIYSAILAALYVELDDAESVIDRYLTLVKRISTGLTVHRHNRDSAIDVEGMVDELNLGDFFERRGLAKSIPGVSSGLSEMQLTCRLVIQAYTGMRANEALTLPYACLILEKDSLITHRLIAGRTTKFEKGRIRRTRWVTSTEGHRAVNLARKIASVIYEDIGDTPDDTLQRVNKYPLFIMVAYLKFTGLPSYQEQQDIYQSSEMRLASPGFEGLMSRIRPLIREEDLLELEAIDPHRAWRSEGDFQVGQPWVLKTHQFRRSLALYAQRSGLVSLPSLRRQLQHITREMSLYYSKGSIFARNFIEDDPTDYSEHMCKDWREAKPVSEALAFLREVVFAEERLFGGAGTFEQQKKNRGQVVDREATIQQFKKGLIAYKEIPFGGCVKVGDCDKIGLRVMGVLCLNDCKNIVVKLSRLDRMIDRQQHLVGSLDRISPTYNMEKDDLDSMLKARNRCLEISTGTAKHG